MTPTLTRALRGATAVISCGALLTVGLPISLGLASQGAFDQPAAGADWTLSDVDPLSTALPLASQAFMKAANTFAANLVQIDISVADSATGEVSLRYYSPQNDLVGWHGSVSGDFEIPPVIGSTRIVAPRVDEGEKDKPFGAQDNRRDYGYGCIAPAGVVDVNGNVPAGTAWECSDLGTLTLTFSKPVVDPVLSLAGLGGGLQSPNSILYSYLVAPRLDLVEPAGATVSLLKGNGNLVASGTTIGVPHPGTWAVCNSTYNAPAIGANPGFAAKAGCGTVQVTGSGKTFKFSLSKKVYMLENSANISGAINKPTIRTATDQFALQVGAYIPATQTINYVANGGSGTTASTTGPAGWDTTLAANAFTAPGTSTFLGWSTNPNATVADSAYDPGDIIAMPAGGLTLYAVWDPPASASLIYDANGGSGTMSPTTGPIGSAATVAGNGFIPPAGSTFLGWSTDPNATAPDPAYDPGDTVVLAAGGQTLYAVWESSSPVTVSATDDNYRTPMNTPMTRGNAKAGDSSPAGLNGATYTQLSEPKHGTVSGWDPVTGKFTYIPKKNWTGTDSFRYRVCLAAPNQGVCAQATEYITVTPVKPGAKPVTPPLLKDFGLDPTSTKHTFNPLGIFVASKGARVLPGTLSLAKSGSKAWTSSVTVPGQGTFRVVNGKVTFVPEPSFVGNASVRYRAQDSTGQWATSTLTATVAWSKPIAAPLRKNLGVWRVTQPYTFNAIRAFTPSQGSTAVKSSLVIAASGSSSWGSRVQVPGKGVFTLSGNGRVTYVGPACFTGTATVRYRAKDATGKWAASTLTIHVRHPGGKDICRL